jgi:hypothetical protein
MAASNWTSDDNTTALLKKLVDNLADACVDASKTGSQTSNSDDTETTLLQKAVTNTFILAH